MMTVEVSEGRPTASTIASVLVEVLPYIEHFKNQTIVVKVGGSALVDPQAAEQFAADIALMHMVGINPVVVHGGGPQISAMMKKFGKEPIFSEGHRVTDSEALDITRMVLVGRINRDIVTAINRHGSIALGLSGEDADLLVAVERHPDLGFVGDVSAVNTEVVNRLIAEDLVPVIATIGVDETGQAYNINADAGAAAIAAELNALKLIYLTDVEGLFEDPNDPASLIKVTTVSGLEAAVRSGAVTSGMIPKIDGCLTALKGGVDQAHILGSGIAHALLVELFTDSGIGTMISSEGE